MEFFKGIKPNLAQGILPTIANAKAYLDKKIASKKSIIYFSKPSSIALKTEDLDGYTISLFDLKTEKEKFKTLKTDVETANGNFILASSIDDLNQVLSYK